MLFLTRLAPLASLIAFAEAQFDPLHHLGGNGPWFAGPNVFNISPDPPAGCVVDQAAFISRHGARYPDPSAYYQWTNLSAKIHAQAFNTTPELAFLQTWQPQVRYPDQDISMLNVGGYKELYDMGTYYRFQYPTFFKSNSNYTLWANMYQAFEPRVIDSARLFARGYLGPNSTFGDVEVLNNTDPRSIANSLAPSDLCPTYLDNSGGNFATTWANVYLPPIVTRINKLITGLQFNSTDVVQFPYLCGFETPINGYRSPWCNVFTEEETLAYEYAQDIRYWYGSGLGTTVDQKLMLPFLTAVVERFVDGPNASYPDGNGTSAFHPPMLIATFTNDGQINQLAAAIGVFDNQPQLPDTYILTNRTFKASNFVTMRGTIGFERLSCGAAGSKYMRIKLNDAVYPVVGCQSGPGSSCPLLQYQNIVANKSAKAGDFEATCGIANSSVVPIGQDKTTFLTDLNLPFEYVVKP